MDVFNRPTYDLGIDTTYESTKEDIDKAFTTIRPDNTSVCIACSNEADYKLIAKHEDYNTEEIKTRGYLCRNCLKQGGINPKQYGVREIKKD